MARPLKQGIDYFSMDVNIFGDRKIKRVIHSCGAASVAVFLKLWCSIYDEKGYYIAVDDDLIFDIKVDTSTEDFYVQKVIDKCVEANVFNASLYKRYKILTSKRIQSNYLSAIKRRNDGAIKPEFLLTETDDMPIIADNNEVNVNNNPVIADNSTQSKVKESKLNKSKVNNNTPAPEKTQFADNVSLTQKEYDTLIAKYGEEAVKWMIAKLDNAKGSKGYKYKSDYRAILNWVVDSYFEKTGKAPPDKPAERQTSDKYSETY